MSSAYKDKENYTKGNNLAVKKKDAEPEVTYVFWIGLYGSNWILAFHEWQSMG